MYSWSRNFCIYIDLWSVNGSRVSCLLFVGTVAEGAPVVPISAQLKYNIDAVCEYVVKKIPIPDRDFLSEPRLIGKNNSNCDITVTF